MDKVKLPGGPEKTVTWIWLQGGQLKVEFYDFSETALRMFGNDIAYILTVERSEMKKLYSLTNQNEHSLLEWISKTFTGFSESSTGLMRIILPTEWKRRVGHE